MHKPNSMNKAIFLDRDGVLNRELGDYVTRKEDFVILPHVLEALKIMQNNGFLLIVITNQGGIAKGRYSLAELDRIHQYFINECSDNGITITDIFFSPHHEVFTQSLSRKPASLMLERAVAKYKIDKDKSYMIGDSQRDIDAANKINIRGLMIPSNSSLLDIIDALN